MSSKQFNFLDMENIFLKGEKQEHSQFKACLSYVESSSQPALLWDSVKMKKEREKCY